MQQGQGAQPEEVHLEQAHPLDLLHRPLGGDLVLLALVDRRELGDRPGGDDHPGGVHGGVAGDALEALRHRHQLLHLRVALLEVLEIGALLERLLEGHVEGGRYLLGHPVDVGVRHPHGSADVPHDGAGLHRPEGDDLGHVVPPVLAGDVVDDLAPAALAEVDVDVGQGDAFRVEETLEDQVELHRVDVGDLQAPGDEAPRRRPPARTHRNALLAGVADEVPDDQEVAGIAHPDDDVDLVREPGLVVGDGVLQLPGVRLPPQRLEAPPEPLPGHVLEVAVERERLRDVEVRQVVLVGRELHVAAFGDGHGVRERVRVVAEHRAHLVPGLQVELVPVVAQALLVGDVLAGADAQQDVVGAPVLPPQVVDVVGADERQIEVAGHRQEAGVHDPLLVDALVLHLEEEVAGTEDVPIGGRRLARPLRLLGAEARRHLALQAAAQADEPLRVPGQQLLVDPRLVVEALGVAGGDQLDEVVIAGEVLGQEHEVVVGLPRRAAPLATAAGRDVDLAAEDRLDPPFPRLVVEHHAREHVAVLGDGEGRCAGLPGVVEQLTDAAGAVEQRVLGVEVEMDELGHGLPLDSRMADAAGRPTRSRRAAGHSHSIVDGGLLLTS